VKRGDVISRKISEKEDIFCKVFAAAGQASRAAALAGLSREEECYSLLARKDIAAKIKAYASNIIGGASNAALAGLMCVASGSIADALELIRGDSIPSAARLRELDLSCVSEVKKTKDGGIELKFYDRLKAVQILFEKDEEKSGAAQAFYSAIREGANVCREDGEGG
jgi:hypothetical protein